MECKPRRLPADLGSMSDGRYASSGPTETGNVSGWLQKKSLRVGKEKRITGCDIPYLIDAVCHCLQDLLVADACEP